MSLTKQNKTKMEFGEHKNISDVIKQSGTKTKRVQVIIDDDLHKKFKITCMKQGLTISDVMTNLIINWLEKNN